MHGIFCCFSAQNPEKRALKKILQNERQVLRELKPKGQAPLPPRFPSFHDSNFPSNKKFSHPKFQFLCYVCHDVVEQRSQWFYYNFVSMRVKHGRAVCYLTPSPSFGRLPSFPLHARW